MIGENKMEPKRISRLVPVVALLVLYAGCVERQGESQRPEATAAYQRVLDTIRLAGAVPGVSAAIMRDGELVFAGGTGDADRERGLPATGHTVYPIGSITKLLTAGALVRLASDGILDLDDPIADRVPEFADRRVTLRMLAGHLSGIRHYEREEYRNPEPVDRIESTLARFVDDPLEFEPGARYRYSSYGYVLLGVAMERAAATPFTLLVENTVTGPMDLAIHPETLADPARAAGYDRLEDEVAPSPAHSNSDRWPAGGYVADMPSLAAFAHRATTGFFTPTEETVLFTPQVTTDGESTGVGAAWRIAVDPEGRTYYHHAGSTYGGRAVLVVYPDEAIVVTVAGNLGRAPFATPDAQFLVDLALCDGGSPPGDGWAGDYDLTIRRKNQDPIEATLNVDSAGDGVVGMGEESLAIGWAGECDGRLLVAAIAGGSGTELFWLHRDGERFSGHTWRGDDDLTATRAR